MVTSSSNVGFVIAPWGSDAGIGGIRISFSGLKVTGNITASGDITANSYNLQSDHRIKSNISNLLFSSISPLQLLRPVSYNLIQNPYKTQFGFIAHEVQEYYPDLVTGTKDEVDASGNPVIQSINYIGFIPLLVKENQLLRTELDTLKDQLNRLQQLIDTLIINKNI
jgi:hypothetical protein